MSHTKRWMLGVASFAPLASLLLYQAVIGFGKNPLAFFAAVVEASDALLVLIGGTVLVGLMGLAYVLVWLARTPRFTVPTKTAWAVLLTTAGVVTLPLFWLLYVRPRAVAPGSPATA